jgi:tetratricopeptide (TPR) repeat protein
VVARVALVDYQRRLMTVGVGDAEKARAAIQTAIERFEEAGDASGLARAWRLAGVIEGTAGRHEVAAEAMRKAITYASDVGDSRLAARATISFSYAILHGPTPVPEALALCEEFAPLVSTDRSAEAVVLGVIAQLQAMRREFVEARALYERSRMIISDLGPSVSAASTSLEASRVEMLAGDPRAAERMLARDFDVLSSMGENYFRSTIAALRAQALWALGERAEAAAFASIARDLSEEDDVLSQVAWRSVHAKALAVDGHVTEAYEIATEALELTDGSVDIELRADVLSDLADVLRLIGRENEQEPHLREALALYSAKGDLVLAGETRRRLETVVD